MNGHGIEQDMSAELGAWLEATYDYEVELGAWLEATYDPDNPPYDTLDEQNGHA